jgi:hypothetical protein
MDWSLSDDPEILGAVVELVGQHSELIDPPLSPMDVGELLMRNFSVALRLRPLPPVGSHAFSAYEAARELGGWFEAEMSFADGRAEEEAYAMAQRLAAEFKSADDEGKNCMVTGLLEHLFENEKLKALFTTWKDDPELWEAYQASLQWANWVEMRFRALADVVRGVVSSLRRDGLDASVRDRASRLAMPIIVVKGRESFELHFDCDNDWVHGALGGTLSIPRAVRFAQDRGTWKRVDHDRQWFEVKLEGGNFQP